jgi:deoxyribonuclease V
MHLLAPNRHRWNVTPARARAIQQELRSEVLTEDARAETKFVAGVDVGYADKATTRAAVAVLKFPDLSLHESIVACRPVSFPYVPGLLSFREVPAVLAALRRLRRRPDLILCDGHGLAHPRRFGLACHLGILTGIASIGVAKTRLIGEHGPLAREKGSWVPLVDGQETIGAVLRTRTDVKPLYVSIGHKVSLLTAIDLVLCCLTRYRLPETTRWAHRLASGI